MAPFLKKKAIGVVPFGITFDEISLKKLMFAIGTIKIFEYEKSVSRLNSRSHLYWRN